METQYVRYNTTISIVKDSIRELNPQFSLCDVMVCYHGDNRNRTSISKTAIENALYSLYGIPIVGEWLYKDDGDGKFGDHGGRVIIDSEGIRFEQTTKPFGFVTEEAVKNAEWVEVTEKNGHTTHEYLKLTGCVLWTKRYDECKVILDEDHGQSMEITVNKGNYREDGFFDIEEFVFSALCILGNDYEPCFEGAQIGRHYAFDDFRREVTKMLDEYKAYQIDSGKEEKADLKDMIMLALAAHTFNISESESDQKYIFVGFDEKSVHAIDRESYKAYSIPYVAGEDGNSVALDFESKTEMSIGCVEHCEDGFDLGTEIEKASHIASERAIAEQSSVFQVKYDELSGKYAALEEECIGLREKVTAFEQREAQDAADRHKEAVDAKIEEFAALVDFEGYQAYKKNIDYSKTAEQIEQDLLVIAGIRAMSSLSGDLAAKFAYKPVEFPVVTPNNDGDSKAKSDRYGGILDE